jgi:hypothetical protein
VTIRPFRKIQERQTTKEKGQDQRKKDREKPRTCAIGVRTEAVGEMIGWYGVMKGLRYHQALNWNAKAIAGTPGPPGIEAVAVTVRANAIVRVAS